MIFGSTLKELCRLTLLGLANFRLLGAILLGVTLTWVLASIGIDARVNDLARLQDKTLSVVWSAFPMLAGMVVPAAAPLVLLALKKRHLAIQTAAAFLSALIIVSLLKGFTSRVHPEALEPATSLLRSQEFRLGFLRDGMSSVVEGWPSGHTATNGAVALTIAGSTKLVWLRFAWLFWFGWVGLATIFGISGDVHWLSDTLAGGLIAWVLAQRMIKGADN